MDTKAGEDFRKKLESGIYSSCKGRIISIKDVSGVEQSEIEDIMRDSWTTSTSLTADRCRRSAAV